MDIDPAHPWGLELDYMGRATATVIEQGLPVAVVVADAEPNRRNTPTITASITVMPDDYSMTAQLSVVTVPAYTGTVWAPNPLLLKAAVEQAATEAVGHLHWLATLIPDAPQPLAGPTQEAP
ncbi:hypothetical protein GCM10009639_54030 [Kitasatospora putterlickiae]|uniref:Uncharacterized protein n=1 Tax=Kitasatospora putterlickiae TaxID=221725 RepID=A0ABN1YIN0_9ACTN